MSKRRKSASHAARSPRGRSDGTTARRHNEDLPAAVDKIRPAIVQILVSSQNEGREPMGTGFFVSPEGVVLTAAHVVTRDAARYMNQLDPPDGSLVVGIRFRPAENIRAAFQLVECRPLVIDDVHDLALLKLVKNPFAGDVPAPLVVQGEPLGGLHGIPEFELRRPLEGAAIAVSGYPLSSATLITNAGVISSSWNLAENDEGTVFEEPGVPVEQYLADISVNPGNSGGPAYRASDGRVVGVCAAIRLAPLSNVSPYVSHLRQNAGLCEIIPIRYGLGLLKAWSTQSGGADERVPPPNLGVSPHGGTRR